jgi:hypothetical protein
MPCSEKRKAGHTDLSFHSSLHFFPAKIAILFQMAQIFSPFYFKIFMSTTYVAAKVGRGRDLQPTVLAENRRQLCFVRLYRM